MIRPDSSNDESIASQEKAALQKKSPIGTSRANTGDLSIAAYPSSRRLRLDRDVRKQLVVHALGSRKEEALDFIRRVMRAKTPSAKAPSNPPRRNFPNIKTTAAPLTNPKATAPSRRFKPPSTTFPVRDFDQNHDIVISNVVNHRTQASAACGRSGGL